VILDGLKLIIDNTHPQGGVTASAYEFPAEETTGIPASIAFVMASSSGSELTVMIERFMTDPRQSLG
jgi:hypothetical protein